MKTCFSLLAALVVSLLISPLALAEEDSSGLPGDYKKLSWADQSIDVIYKELPETVYTPEKALKVRRGVSRLACTRLMGQALQAEEYLVDAVAKQGEADFLCDHIFSGTGREFDEQLGKINETDRSPAAIALKGVSVLAQGAQIVAGAA